MRCLPMLAALGALLAVGCSSDADDSPTPSPPQPSSEACSGPGYAEEHDEQRVDVVRATLVDQDGEPLADELVQVCGLNVCVNDITDPDGDVSVQVMADILLPAFKFGEGRVSARFAWILPNEGDVDLGVVRSVRLPPLEDAVPLTPGSRVRSGGLTLELAADATVKIDKLTFRDPAEHGLRAVRVPLESAPAVVREGPELEIVFAATPVETRFCPPAALSIDNHLGWPAGTDVEVWLHGVDIAEEWAPYGGWAQVSAARVSDDGERIETTEPGLPVLGVLGFRRAP